MAQSLEVQIKATSDVPAVVDKAKQASTSFEKQIEGIGNKFKGAFKDIFLSFLGPMALIGVVMGFIGKLIADNQRKQEEANKAAIDGTNELMSAEDRYWANKKDNEKKVKATIEEARTARIIVTKSFLEDDPRGQMLLNDRKKHAYGSYVSPATLAREPEIQALVQDEILRRSKETPLPNAGKDFIAPTGFSNVIGVGANPVIEAMTAQLEEQRLQTALLQQIVDKGQPPSADFTKEPTSRYPGRGYIPE